jgi:hypothetical protein
MCGRAISWAPFTFDDDTVRYPKEHTGILYKLKSHLFVYCLIWVTNYHCLSFFSGLNEINLKLGQLHVWLCYVMSAIYILMMILCAIEIEHIEI